MKLLCFSVTPTQSALQAFNMENTLNGGGWIDSLIRFLPLDSNNSELWVCSLLWGAETTMETDDPGRENIHYVCFPSATPFLDTVNQKTEAAFRKIIERVNPDVVHIFGTETMNSNVLEKIAGKDRTLVSITGLVSLYEKHFFGGISTEMRSMTTIRDILRGSIFADYRKIKKNARIEIDTLRNCQYVTGRTDWDRACTLLTNPDIHYFFCNENLRDAFYCNSWSYEKCEKHSIFSSSSASPLKGAHQIIEALPIILRHYPDTKLYLTGNDPRESSGLVHRLKRTGYQKYLCKLLDKYEINDAVVFTGFLNEQQMAERCAKSNVYVLPSCIENSPNSLCEAMLMGVPSVASDVGGVPSLLESGKDGFLYPFDEPYMLAYRVMQLFSDEQLAKNLSNNARIRALDRHDRQLNGETMYQIYHQIAENRGKRRNEKNTIHGV